MWRTFRCFGLSCCFCFKFIGNVRDKAEHRLKYYDVYSIVKINDYVTQFNKI